MTPFLKKIFLTVLAQVHWNKSRPPDACQQVPLWLLGAPVSLLQVRFYSLDYIGVAGPWDRICFWRLHQVFFPKKNKPSRGTHKTLHSVMVVILSFHCRMTGLSFRQWGAYIHSIQKELRVISSFYWKGLNEVVWTCDIWLWFHLGTPNWKETLE